MNLKSHRIGQRTMAALVLALGLCATRAQAVTLSYGVILDGLSESPPNGSPGTGIATVDIDTALNSMHIDMSWTGLLGTTTACHIHAATAAPGTGTAGVATTTPYFAGFPIGVTAGTYANTLDLLQSSSYNPAYVTANGGTPASAEAALLSAISAGKAYLNIHTSVVGGGEIRGFLVPVPEPGSLTLLAGAGMLMLRRKRA